MTSSAPLSDAFENRLLTQLPDNLKPLYKATVASLLCNAQAAREDAETAVRERDATIRVLKAEMDREIVRSACWLDQLERLEERMLMQAGKLSLRGAFGTLLLESILVYFFSPVALPIS